MPNGYNYSVAANGTFQFASSKEGVRYFVDNYGKDLCAALANTGIYFPVAVAQKCVESAYGTSRAAREQKNFGGLEVNHVLMTFNTPLACFQKYVETLLSPKHKYIADGLLTSGTALDQLQAIANAGYCELGPTVYYNKVSPLVRTVMAMYSIGKLTN